MTHRHATPSKNRRSGADTFRHGSSFGKPRRSRYTFKNGVPQFEHAEPVSREERRMICRARGILLCQGVFSSNWDMLRMP